MQFQRNSVRTELSSDGDQSTILASGEPTWREGSTYMYSLQKIVPISPLSWATVHVKPAICFSLSFVCHHVILVHPLFNCAAWGEPSSCSASLSIRNSCMPGLFMRLLMDHSNNMVGVSQPTYILRIATMPSGQQRSTVECSH